MEITLTNGAQIYACREQGCCEMLTKACDGSTVLLRNGGPTSHDQCFHCAWCGELLFEPTPGTCLVHEECPDFCGEYTIQAHLVTFALLSKTGRRVTDDGIDLIGELVADHGPAGLGRDGFVDLVTELARYEYLSVPVDA